MEENQPKRDNVLVRSDFYRGLTRVSRVDMAVTLNYTDEQLASTGDGKFYETVRLLALAGF
jgi:hypothetical protein